MTTISALSTEPSPAASSNTIRGSKDEFLKLFMAQLQHQDPLDPNTGADMVAQLAQMTAVEQARETNTQLASLAAAQASNASAGMASLIGRTCDATVAEVALDRPGEVPPIAVEATSPMKGASIVVTDANGKEIRRIAIPDGARSAELVWDGKDARGVDVASGNYSIAVDPGASGSTISASWRARVDAVELTAHGPRLRMGGVLVAPATIRTIGPLASTGEL